MSGLCGVNLVPEDMVVGVGTDVVLVATGEGSQEGWRHVARAGSVSEALLYTHILSQALSFDKWQSVQYLYIIAMASLRYHKKQSIKAISLCVTSLTGYSIHNTRQRAHLQHAWPHWHAGKKHTGYNIKQVLCAMHKGKRKQPQWHTRHSRFDNDAQK